MATPTDKSTYMDDAIKSVFGIDRKNVIEGDMCVFCGKSATEFKDALSALEYTISGICQVCQDKLFK